MDLGPTGLGKKTYSSVIRLTSTQQIPFLQVKWGACRRERKLGWIY
jgi:hypothetical protein